jgi:hypothetical protein
VGGEHSSKELFEQLTLIETSTWLPPVYVQDSL